MSKKSEENVGYQDTYLKGIPEAPVAYENNDKVRKTELTSWKKEESV